MTSVRSHRHTATQWQVVFGLIDDRIYYLTRENPQRREIGMHGFDFACSDAIRMRDVNMDQSRDGAGYATYSRKKNRLRVEPFFKRHPLKPGEAEAKLDRISRYPDSFVCTDPHGT